METKNMARLVLTMKIWRGTDCKNEKKFPSQTIQAPVNKKKKTLETLANLNTHTKRGNKEGMKKRLIERFRHRRLRDHW